MAITVNNLQVSGTSSVYTNYLEGNWIQNDSTTAMSFSNLNISNSTVSGGAPSGWYALLTNGNIDYGSNTGWTFSATVTENGDFFLFFDVNTLP